MKAVACIWQDGRSKCRRGVFSSYLAVFVTRIVARYVSHLALHAGVIYLRCASESVNLFSPRQNDKTCSYSEF